MEDGQERFGGGTLLDHAVELDMVAGGVNERIRLGYGGQAQGDDEAKECESDLAVLAGKHGYVYSDELEGRGECGDAVNEGCVVSVLLAACWIAPAVRADKAEENRGQPGRGQEQRRGRENALDRGEGRPRL